MLPVYQDVVRKPNILKNRNPLKNTIATVISLGSRLTDLNSSKEWKSLIKEYRETAILLDPAHRPTVMMVKLGKLIIDEDIQRALDVKHCAKKIAALRTFDPRLLQVVYCVKTPGKDEFCAVDGQHTAATIAGLVDAGLFIGETDWREVEVAVLYVETTSKAFARKAFALINGKGKKKVSPWYEHRTNVMSVRIDGSTDTDDVEAEQKQQICEKYNCYPIDVDSQFVGKPGTFTHMSAFNLNDSTLELCCKFHDTYFHYDAIDGSLWFMMADIAKSFDAANIKITDSFLGELAGILQGYFAGLAEFHAAVHKAHKLWGHHTYGYEVSWDDGSIAAVLVMLYQQLGGKQKIPQPLLDKFAKLLDFVDDDIKELYTNIELLAA